MISGQSSVLKTSASGRVSGQAAAAKSNRQLQERHSIIKALQGLGYEHYDKWPDFVRQFQENASGRVAYEQPASPSPFQPPAFDRLNQLPAEWAKEAAAAWRPYIETCIEAFGPERSMFESNFPPDKGQCSYQVIFNAFKRIAAPYSEAEKTALFSKTATEFYQLKLG